MTVWTWLRAPGPKYGVARGVGVFGSPGFADDAAGLTSLFECQEGLSARLSRSGRTLSFDPETLALVDHAIDAWRRDPKDAALLGNEVGTFLGAVIVRLVAGARWHVWPNGHPVVRVGRRDIDVVALAAKRVSTGEPALTHVLADAQRRPT